MSHCRTALAVLACLAVTLTSVRTGASDTSELTNDCEDFNTLRLELPYDFMRIEGAPDALDVHTCRNTAGVERWRVPPEPGPSLLARAARAWDLLLRRVDHDEAIQTLSEYLRQNPEKAPFERSIAVLLGVTRYETLEPLSFPDDDVRLMRDFLLHGAAFDEVYILPETVNESEIKAFLHFVSQKYGKKDRLLFYYAGHGRSNRTGEFGTLALSKAGDDGILAGYDYEIHALAKASLEFPQEHVLFILDSCSAGLTGNPRSQTNVAAAQLNIARRLSGSGSRMIYTAGTSDQETFEGKLTVVDKESGAKLHKGHGIFTYAFVRAFYERALTMPTAYILADEVLVQTKANVAQHIQLLNSEKRLSPRDHAFATDAYDGHFVFFNPNARLVDLSLKALFDPNVSPVSRGGDGSLEAAIRLSLQAEIHRNKGRAIDALENVGWAKLAELRSGFRDPLIDYQLADLASLLRPPSVHVSGADVVVHPDGVRFMLVTESDDEEDAFEYWTSEDRPRRLRRIQAGNVHNLDHTGFYPGTDVFWAFDSINGGLLIADLTPGAEKQYRANLRDHEDSLPPYWRFVGATPGGGVRVIAPIRSGPPEITTYRIDGERLVKVDEAEVEALLATTSQSDYPWPASTEVRQSVDGLDVFDRVSGRGLYRHYVRGEVIEFWSASDDWNRYAIVTDRTIAVFVRATRRRLMATPRVTGELDVSAVALSPDGQTLAIGYADGSLRIFDVERNLERFERQVMQRAIKQLAFHPTNQTLALASGEDAIALFDVERLSMLDARLAWPIWYDASSKRDSKPRYFGNDIVRLEYLQTGDLLAETREGISIYTPTDFAQRAQLPSIRPEARGPEATHSGRRTLQLLETDGISVLAVEDANDTRLIDLETERKIGSWPADHFGHDRQIWLDGADGLAVSWTRDPDKLVNRPVVWDLRQGYALGEGAGFDFALLDGGGQVRRQPIGRLDSGALVAIGQYGASAAVKRGTKAPQIFEDKHGCTLAKGSLYCLSSGAGTPQIARYDETADAWRTVEVDPRLLNNLDKLRTAEDAALVRSRYSDSSEIVDLTTGKALRSVYGEPRAYWPIGAGFLARHDERGNLFVVGKESNSFVPRDGVAITAVVAATLDGGDVVIIGKATGTVEIWRMREDARLFAKAMSSVPIRALAFSERRRRLFTLDEDGRIHGWTLPELVRADDEAAFETALKFIKFGCIRSDRRDDLVGAWSRAKCAAAEAAARILIR